MSKELDLGRVVGKDATINGQNTINIVAGSNIDIQQQDGTLTIGVDNTHFNDKSNPHEVTADQVGAVPVSRTVNGKPLSENISLNAADVGASPTGHSHADKQDKLTGTPDQYVTFDENGNAVAKQKDYSLFGFQINRDESDPSKIIKYIAQNASYDPAFMDYEKDEFNYGDWADAWFIKGIKVVLLNNNGTIDTELNPNDYTKKINSNTIMNIENPFTNVMVGIPTVWVRYTVLNGKDTFYFSDQKLSDNFYTYAHTAADGSIMPYTYLAAYNGWKDSNGKLRSVSGKTPTVADSATAEITAAKANNPTGKNMWDIDVLADRNLINLLLLLIGKSTDTQTTFGNGRITTSTDSDDTYRNKAIPTGTMNDKGLFWGSNADNLGVKVFGIEHWWGNMQRRTQGLILDNGVYKIKMTYGTEDGSTVEGYNTTGEGYIDTGLSPSKFLGYFITSMHVKKIALLPSEVSGSSTTYFCDEQYSVSDGKQISQFGGGISGPSSGAGAFACRLTSSINPSTNCGACISCKPY